VVSENSPADLRDLARKFGAQFVIEGTVRRTGDKAVITAQLIDGTTDTHFWSTRFEQVGVDQVALEKAAADKLSAELGGMTGKMREAYERIAWSKADDDLTEFDYYVRGHTHHMRFTVEERLRARDIYIAGLKRYPKSALLRIKVAWVDFATAGGTYANPGNKELAQANALVSEARESLGARRKSRCEEYYLHWISSSLYQIDKDFGRCIGAAKAAIELTPYDPWVRGTLAYNLAECGGNLDEAIRWTKQAIELQPDGPPHDPEYYMTVMAWIYYLGERCGDAVAVIQTMKNQPLMTLAVCQVQLGQREAAQRTMAAYVKDNPGWTVQNEVAYPMVEPLQQRWVKDIRAAGLPES
jgi:tetratricopeptide (TPR) repeat protein